MQAEVEVTQHVCTTQQQLRPMSRPSYDYAASKESHYSLSAFIRDVASTRICQRPKGGTRQAHSGRFIYPERECEGRDSFTSRLRGASAIGKPLIPTDDSRKRFFARAPLDLAAIVANSARASRTTLYPCDPLAS